MGFKDVFLFDKSYVLRIQAHFVKMGAWNLKEFSVLCC